MPNLLTAPPPPPLPAQDESEAQVQNQNLYQDYPQGYYADGAYIALPSFPSRSRTAPAKGGRGADDITDPQEVYYASLLHRFLLLSSSLHSSPPPQRSPDPSTLATAETLNTAPSKKKWRTTLLYTPPTTALMVLLSQETVIGGIAALEKLLSWRMLERRGAVVGAWAWSLLARCREVGMMGSEEVGVVRELGKTARGMVRGLRAGIGGPREEDLFGDGSEGSGSDGGFEMEMDGRREDDGLESMPSDASYTGFRDREGNTSSPEPSTVGIIGPGQSTDPTTDAQQVLDGEAMREAKLRLLATLHASEPPPPSNIAPQMDQRADYTNPPHQLPIQPGSSAQPSSTSSQPPGAQPLSTEATNGTQVPITTRITATLDMIVTIVGEVYGQKDLLEGRMVWE